MLQVFLEETLGYRWDGGDVGDLLSAAGSSSGEELQRVRRGILGTSGASAARVFEALSATLVGIPAETLWWRWRVAMGAVDAAIGMSPVDPSCLGSRIARLVEILVPLLGAGEAGDWAGEEDAGRSDPHPEPRSTALLRPRRVAARALLDPLHGSPS